MKKKATPPDRGELTPPYDDQPLVLTADEMRRAGIKPRDQHGGIAMGAKVTPDGKIVPFCLKADDQAGMSADGKGTPVAQRPTVFLRAEAATMLAAGYSVEAVARQIHVGRSTIYRWQQEPDFQAELDRGIERFRRDFHARAGAAVEIAMERLVNAVRDEARPGAATDAAIALLKHVGPFIAPRNRAIAEVKPDGTVVASATGQNAMAAIKAGGAVALSHEQGFEPLLRSAATPDSEPLDVPVTVQAEGAAEP